MSSCRPINSAKWTQNSGHKYEKTQISLPKTQISLPKNSDKFVKNSAFRIFHKKGTGEGAHKNKAWVGISTFYNRIWSGNTAVLCQFLWKKELIQIQFLWVKIGSIPIPNSFFGTYLNSNSKFLKKLRNSFSIPLWEVYFSFHIRNIQ